MLSVLPALAMILSAQATPVSRRQYLGTSPFSFEYQGEIKQVRSELVEGSDDWLLKVVDWEVAGKDLYLAASLFEGKPGTKMDKAFLKKAVDEFVDGMEAEDESAHMISNQAITIDEQLAQRACYRVGKGGDAIYVQSLFLSSGTNLYSLVAVYFQETGGPADTAKKVIDSVRFKRPLEGTATNAKCGEGFFLR